jgi:S-DNA-T family DNA segregation ATPase FtsK/SpoIIIE
MAAHVVWAVSLLLCAVLLTERWWSPRVDHWLTSRRSSSRPWAWWLAGYPLTVVRMRVTWRRLCQNTGLSVIKRPRGVLVGRDSFVMGASLRPVPPWLGVARATRDGLRVRVRMHPGQTPELYNQVAEALAHAWRVHAVRVVSPRKGEVELRAMHRDPLAVEAAEPVAGPPRRVLVVVVGRLEAGAPWLLDLREVPHWLIIGATQSGKSTLLAALVSGLAPQPVALVGIDCKGGLALSPFEARLSALATDRAEAVELLEALVRETQWRMSVCRAAGVQNIWELPPDDAPLPVVVLVDELAELYLTDGTRESKQEAAAASASLLRLAQLGAALGVHLVVAGQRVGSELGPGVTALRAQLGGRVCHRVNDATTAEMALGDLYPDAVAVAQSIGEWERGVAVTTVGGVWARARSLRISPTAARRTADRYRHRTPTLAGLGPVHGSGPADGKGA